METTIDAAIRNGHDAAYKKAQATGNSPARSEHAVTADDMKMAAARRKFTAAHELLMSFEPTAEQLTEAARAIVKIAHRAINPRKSSADEEA